MEQEQRAKDLGFKYNNIFKLDELTEAKLSNTINKRVKRVENGVTRADQMYTKF